MSILLRIFALPLSAHHYSVLRSSWFFIMASERFRAGLSRRNLHDREKKEGGKRASSGTILHLVGWNLGKQSNH